MTFVRRIMEVRFELGTGDFGDGKSNSVTLKSPIRMRADIDYAGDAAFGQLSLRVYGIPFDIMAKLTVLNKYNVGDTRRNTVTVMAGDENTGLSVCFIGIIQEAWADMRSSPDVMLVVSANNGSHELLKPISPTSYRGTIDVATVLAGLGAQLNPPLTLENSGVNVQIASPYLAGDIYSQITTIATAADINCMINPDGSGNILAIWPRDGARKARDGPGLVPLISKETGMVGYPAFSQSGLSVTTLFNPSLTFGRQFRLKTVFPIPMGDGIWRIDHVSHNLESETPNGAWFTEVDSNLTSAPVGLK